MNVLSITEKSLCTRYCIVAAVNMFWQMHFESLSGVIHENKNHPLKKNTGDLAIGLEDIKKGLAYPPCEAKTMTVKDLPLKI